MRVQSFSITIKLVFNSNDLMVVGTCPMPRKGATFLLMSQWLYPWLIIDYSIVIVCVFFTDLNPSSMFALNFWCFELWFRFWVFTFDPFSFNNNISRFSPCSTKPPIERRPEWCIHAEHLEFGKTLVVLPILVCCASNMKRIECATDVKFWYGMKLHLFWILNLISNRSFENGSSSSVRQNEFFANDFNLIHTTVAVDSLRRSSTWLRFTWLPRCPYFLLRLPFPSNDCSTQLSYLLRSLITKWRRSLFHYRLIFLQDQNICS